MIPDAAVTDDAVYGHCIERGPLTVARGRAEVERTLRAEAAEILVRVERGRDVLFEGRLPDATVAASLQLDESGAVRRGLAFRTRPVAAPDPSAWNGHDARAALDTYLAHLEEGDFARAAGCFAGDALYSHPPYDATGDRVDVVGRDALRALFERRGRQPWRHRTIVAIQSGSHCLVEGDVEGLGSFISSLSLDEDGRILRYVSFYTEPGLPRA